MKDFDPKNPITLNEAQHRALISLCDAYASASSGRASTGSAEDMIDAVSRVVRNFDDHNAPEKSRTSRNIAGTDKDEFKVERHESYAMLLYTRSQGNPGQLFGSPLNDHASFFVLRMAEAHRTIDRFGHERFVATGKTLFELFLSNEQFVNLITGMNVGFGTPVTIRSFDGREMAKPPRVASELTEVQAAAERFFVGDDLKELLGRARKLEEQHRGAKNEEKREIAAVLLQMIYALDNNARYRLTLYRDVAAKVTGHAKREIIGLVETIAHAAGAREIARQLADGLPVPQLPEHTDEKG